MAAFVGYKSQGKTSEASKAVERQIASIPPIPRAQVPAYVLEVMKKHKAEQDVAN